MPLDSDTYASWAVLVGLSDVTFPGTAKPEGLLLRSESISSKWGFDDGDVPDAVDRMIDAFYGHYRFVSTDVWHPVLWDLVREHLLPALTTPMVGVFTCDTIHNPVRVDPDPPKDFPHTEVHVPWLEVLIRVLIRMPEAKDEDN